MKQRHPSHQSMYMLSPSQREHSVGPERGRAHKEESSQMRRRPPLPAKIESWSDSSATPRFLKAPIRRDGYVAALRASAHFCCGTLSCTVMACRERELHNQHPHNRCRPPRDRSAEFSSPKFMKSGNGVSDVGCDLACVPAEEPRHHRFNQRD